MLTTRGDSRSPFFRKLEVGISNLLHGIFITFIMHWIHTLFILIFRNQFNDNQKYFSQKYSMCRVHIIYSFRNTARRFFQRPDIVSTILGVPAELVWGVGEIWSTLTSGHFINTQLFEEFCEGWMEVYKESSINWYLLSPTLHKVLKHGRQIIENFPLPIGWFSEECSGI